MIALLYDVEVATVNYHLKKMLSTTELEEGQVIRDFRITARFRLLPAKSEQTRE